MRERFGPGAREKETDEELAAAKREAKAQGQLSIFDTAPQKQTEDKSIATSDSARSTKASKPRTQEVKTKKHKKKEHKYSTGAFKISHRKLNMLGNQISGTPINYAILQMQFSEKRASKRIMNMLATARDHAVRYKNLDLDRLVVSEAWTNKGISHKKFEPRGRGHFGFRTTRRSKLHVVLREGKTLEEEKAAERAYKLKKVVSANAVREDKPLRGLPAMWAW
ncbi:50S ribosomal protein L22 [Dendrothele bispora CBS 962.96]|uniref:50S ribosomal protein L22 n=1 Tax=Dendrothele bispora (strain CBS 962.96) TaxID=1314807 RepID=A0A4S8MYT8_DENBC|nr:50S ribosomal protein L22 [Dendrothele bispora CBS 962.96]